MSTPRYDPHSDRRFPDSSSYRPQYRDRDSRGSRDSESDYGSRGYRDRREYDSEKDTDRNESRPPRDPRDPPKGPAREFPRNPQNPARDIRDREGIKIDASHGPSRIDTRIATPSRPHPTSESPKSNTHPITANEEMANLFSRYGDVIAEKIHLKIELEATERKSKKRKNDLDKYLPKHADFPSLPDMTEQFIKKDNAEHNHWNALYYKHMDKYNKLNKELASSIWQTLPRAEIKDKLVRSTQATSQPGNSDMEAQLRSLQQQVKDLTSSVQKQDEREKEQARHHEAALAKQAKEFDEKLAQQSEKIKKKLEAAERHGQHETTTALEKASTWAKSQITSEVAQIVGRVDDLTKQLQRQNETVEKLRSSASSSQDRTDIQASVDAHTRALEDIENRLQEQRNFIQSHTDVLSEIDVNKLDEVVEKVVMDFPDRLAERLENLESTLPGQIAPDVARLAQLEKEVSLANTTSQQAKDSCGGLKAAQDNIIQGFGGMVNGLRNDNVALTERVSALESMPGGGEPSAAASEQLAQQMATLEHRVEEGLERAKTDLEATSRFLNHQITNLDSQYANITTKHVSEHIIGHMERLYPSARAIIEDSERISLDLRSLQRRVEQLESANVQLQAELRKDLRTHAGSADRLKRDERSEQLPKKRRIGSVDGQQVVENGNH